MYVATASLRGWIEMLPILISIPHGRTQQPLDLQGRVCLSEEDLFDDSDAFTGEVRDLRSKVACVVSADTARAFVDVERGRLEWVRDKLFGTLERLVL
jgi:formiminoglutamase